MKKQILLTLFMCLLLISGVSSQNIQSGSESTLQSFRLLDNDDLELNDYRWKPQRHRLKFSKGCFEKGNHHFAFGYGFPNITKLVFSIYKTRPGYRISAIGPIHFRYEYGISEKIGIGLGVNYVSSDASWDMDVMDTTYREGFEHMGLAINVRLNWHFYTNDKLDLYAAFAVGYALHNFKYYTTFVDEFNIMPEVSMTAPIPVSGETLFGLRYYLSSNIAFYTELGFSSSLAQAGLHIKI